jgi:hypothetical protein
MHSTDQIKPVDAIVAIMALADAYAGPEEDSLSPRRLKLERALLAHMDGQAIKAARYDWLAARLLGADFDWNESGKCALIFEWPSNVAVGGSCDQNLDAAMAEGADRE